jgi:hypothetical protein
MEKPMKTYSYLLKLNDFGAEGIAPSNGTLMIAMQSPRHQQHHRCRVRDARKSFHNPVREGLPTIRKSSRGVLNRNSEHVRTPGAYG